MRTVGLMALLMTPHVASAACSAMNTETFEKLVVQAQDAIDNDDLVAHGQVFRALQEQLPCMDAAVPSNDWAEFLIGFAMIEFVTGREWEHAMDVALTINGGTNPQYGPVEIRNYVTGVDYTPEGAPLLPEDAEVYLDGVRIRHAPTLGRLHIVQRQRGGVWETRVVQNEPFPEDWLAPAEVEQGPAESSDASMSVAVFGVGGLSSAGQVVDGSIAGLADRSGAGALVGLGSYGAYYPAGSVGMSWDVQSPIQLADVIGVHAFVGPAIDLGPVSLHPAVGLVSVGVEDVNDLRAVLVPRPNLSVQRTQALTGGLDLELGLGGGAMISGWHASGRAGVRGGGNTGWNAGLEFQQVTVSFVESQGSASASASALRLGLRAGVSFGG